MPLGADTQTDRHIHIPTREPNIFKKPGSRGLRPLAPDLKKALHIGSILEIKETRWKSPASIGHLIQWVATITAAWAQMEMLQH